MRQQPLLPWFGHAICEEQGIWYQQPQPFLPWAGPGIYEERGKWYPQPCAHPQFQWPQTFEYETLPQMSQQRATRKKKTLKGSSHHKKQQQWRVKQKCQPASGGKVLHDLVKSVNNQLLAIELPEWFRQGPTDMSAREAGKWAPCKGFRDWSNLSGSALMLAMLKPDHYGIADTPSLSQAFETDGPWYLESLTRISLSRQKSGIGINNRRTNIVEGLLNHFADLPTHKQIHHDLHRAWQLMFRAIWVGDPENKHAHEDQLRDALATSDPIEDDIWWTTTQQRLTDEDAQRAREFARADASRARELALAETSHAPELAHADTSSVEIVVHIDPEKPVEITDQEKLGEMSQAKTQNEEESMDPSPDGAIQVTQLCFSEAIAHTSKQMLAAGLPQWFVLGPTAKSSKTAACGDYTAMAPDWTNNSASALLLAMLEPEKYGIACPSLFSVLDADKQEQHLQTWTALSKAKHGIIRSRADCVKGLFLHFSSQPGCEEVVLALRRSLELMTRNIWVVDSDNKMENVEQLEKACTLDEATENDVARLSRKCQLDDHLRSHGEADLWSVEECDRMFEIILPRLRMYVDQCQPGEEVTGLTYAVMRSWLPGEGFSSSKKGPSPLLKRLWAKAEAQLREWRSGHDFSIYQ